MKERVQQLVDSEWVAFPGGELEGRRPRALCAACRERLKHTVWSRRKATDLRSSRNTNTGHRRTLCFECYRAELNRERAMKTAGELNTASEARFQSALPFEPVNRPRLNLLRAERADERRRSGASVGKYEDRRRRAQIAARHALQDIAAELEASGLVTTGRTNERSVNLALQSLAHVAELQLPDSWLPFIMAR
jgi:hypothetical protein